MTVREGKSFSAERLALQQSYFEYGFAESTKPLFASAATWVAFTRLVNFLQVCHECSQRHCATERAHAHTYANADTHTHMYTLAQAQTFACVCLVA